MVIIKPILDWTRWLFGTGEFDIKSYQHKFGDRMRWFFLGQHKLILNHDQTNYGTQRCDVLGQEKLILGRNKMNYGTKQGHFLGYLKVILVNIRRWSHGRFQDDDNIFHKMKNDLTTRTWQDNIWCPINIILFCTSDVTYIGFKVRMKEICPKTITLLLCKLMDNHQTCSTPITPPKQKKSVASNDITN